MNLNVVTFVVFVVVFATLVVGFSDIRGSCDICKPLQSPSQFITFSLFNWDNFKTDCTLTSIAENRNVLGKAAATL